MSASMHRGLPGDDGIVPTVLATVTVGAVVLVAAIVPFAFPVVLFVATCAFARGRWRAPQSRHLERSAPRRGRTTLGHPQGHHAS